MTFQESITMVDVFSRPIPGQSLTATPKNAPWERPPELVETGEVVKFYINKLADEDVMDDLAITFEMGADLKTVVETMMVMGTMKGMHTVEVGMLAGPIVATFIKAAMSTYGIEVKETATDPKEARKAKNVERMKLLMKRYIETNPDKDAGSELIEELSEVDTTAVEQGATEPQQEQEPMMEAEAAPTGLMTKGEV